MTHNPNKGFGYLEFQVVRNDKDFINIIDKNLGEIHLVSFDHDLACFDKNGKEFTGKDACQYLIDKCLDSGRKFPNWYVHTDNPSGRENILGLILNYIKNIDGVDISDFRYYHRGYINGQFI